MLALGQLTERIGQDHWYTPTFGGSRAVIAAKKALVRRVFDRFKQTFPASADREVAACFVPGRVEVLGKHTDYAGGRSLLAAVDRGFFCVSGCNAAGQIRLMEDDPRFGECQFALSPEIEPVVGHWSNYPMTMSRRLAANFHSPAGESDGGCELSGVDVAFGCDLPVAGGLSGSSALMILTYFAIGLPNRLAESRLYRANIKHGLDLAMYLACAENGQTFRGLTGRAGVGTFGGSEDHTQILNARPGMLSLYQFCPTRFEEEILFPEDLSLIIAHSGIEAVKTGAAMERYNRASRRARVTVETYNRAFASNHQLLSDLADERGLDATLSVLAAGAQAPDLDLPGRFRQFYEEDRRLIPAAAAALKARDYTRFGQIVDESHALSRIYLQNIIPEIDVLQRSARALGAVAASGFGAGFGGSAYAIVAKDSEERFVPAWRQAYLGEFPRCAGACHFFSAAATGQAGELFV